ncbi:MAG TPA: sigma-54 dependent transcriptional regulator, partial [Bacteroidota bacterium]|nr:sigma-54 dependent transcriptional regulator [Bacteroidota bacterium]
MSALVLLVDDDSSVLASLALLLKQAGYRSHAVTSPKEAMLFLSSNQTDIVIQDMNFSRTTTGEEGLRLLKDIKLAHPQVPVILMTGWGSISLAVDGVKAGAFDFITKPWTNEQLLQSVKTALGLVLVGARSEHRKIATREELDTQYDFSSIIGSDPKLVAALEITGRVSNTDASVLISGESGTGKELVAEAIHRNSQRKNGPFLKVNLGGIATSLFDSEMFGHVKGAFTDARQDRQGRFAAANGGTIFLDEIGDLDSPCQVKMLRVLQDRTFEPVGSNKPLTVDVRVISASNVDLAKAVAEGRFREDLLYRINLIYIHLPPLRERRNDILSLANHFLRRAANIYGKTQPAFTDGAIEWLKNQPWPGNIRQLKQVVERAVILGKKETFGINELSGPAAAETERTTILPPVGGMTLDEIERAVIIKTI